MTDEEAWLRYDYARNLYDKMFVLKSQSIWCEPASVPVPESGDYVTKPQINLRGMGLSAQVHRNVDKGALIGNPGDIVCPFLEGTHVTVDFERDRDGDVRCVDARIRVGDVWLWQYELIGKDIWSLMPYTNQDGLVRLIGELLDPERSYPAVETVNMEGVLSTERAAIRAVWEVHLRGNPDPRYEFLFPIFRSVSADFFGSPWELLEAFEDCDGLLNTPRRYFLARGRVEP
jgi:hypothetical protein